LKCFPSSSQKSSPQTSSSASSLRSRLLQLCGTAVFVAVAGWMISARGALPSWIRNIEAGSALEAAFFRAMPLPGGMVLFRRPPAETRTALGELIKSQANQAQPNNANLYSLRALEDEQQLDFSAAESDWKKYSESAPAQASAQLALADFYHRRVRPLDEIKTLSVVANAPPDAAEKLTAPVEQQSWQAFERIFNVIRDQGLPQDFSVAQYRAWLARYPQEQSLYARFLDFLVAQKDYAAASQLVADYHHQFPGDEVFPVKAKAMVEYRRGSIQQGLAVYEQSFQPLWAPELVKSYFDLLAQTQSLRKFLDQARAALNANPEDLNAMTRVFYYYQQQGKLDAAQQTVTRFRLHKEARHADWSGQELYVCARLLQDIHAYPESARYYFALYNSKGMKDAKERALAELTDLLLSAPESPVPLGSGELSMYRDIATMDPGPGYLNGILSLILNTTAPAAQFSQEEQRAVPYFHRSGAAELLKLLDTKFPNSTRRPELHAKLLEFYANSAESEAVIQGGREFLSNFPSAPQRTAVSLLMADAYSRTGKTQEEFAIYDAVLQELAAKAERIPLGKSVAGGERAVYSWAEAAPDASDGEGEDQTSSANGNPRQPGAFQPGRALAATQLGARSPEYARVLERYLARLVQLKQIPEALAVLRRELDRNPDDPGLYERLAVFLDQNRLGVEQEEIYRRALACFPERSWYDKLARFYLRYKKAAEFEKLTQNAVKAFTGTDLEQYFGNVGYGGTPALYLRLNQYANQRFPHNPVFVRNLLNAYHTPATYDDAAWQALLRLHWFEEPDLRSQFFEYLSWRGMLESELKDLEQNAPQKQWDDLVRSNPAAGEFVVQAELWRSHFEESASALKALAAIYPAAFETGRTASAVYRSLAHFDPGKTAVAVKMEDNLLQANPGNTEIMARIGDIYADRDLFTKAAPYWDRIPQVAPGQSGGYLEAASIYWDYFDFDNALRLLHEGRKKLGDENLYRYEAGAIYENQRDYSHAIVEYVQGALAGGANSTADLRLIGLARRTKLRRLVEQETARLITSPAPPMPVVDLRVRVLEAQDRKTEIESFLESVVQGTTSIEQAESLEALAQQKSLEAVREHALEKEAALTIDPVTRLQLRYRLVQLYENRKDLQSAQRNVEALYHDNPKILGVVRSTVDFYWRTKMYPQGIVVLLQATKDAYPELGKQFAFEAARKSTEAGQYPKARDLLSKPLSDAPYDGQYLAAMADTYAQAGDDGGLRQFYLDKIALFRNAPFSGDERKARIATLRRGLIPALTRMKDYAGAVDQYIELINNFPEDAGLVTEATLYALRSQRPQPLVDFYSKTVAQSPRDYRWPMVLARIYTSLEKYPAAIDSYAKAIAIRPDRIDLRLGRAGLEERLMRFDDAAADYERVYHLAYKDPKWMEKLAEVRARQGRTADVVAALKTALVDGRLENAAKYFAAAQRLESWGMLTSARTFAEQGVETAGADLLSTTEQQSGAKLYARIMTRLRQQEKVYATLQSSLAAASSALPVIEEQVAKQGIAAITNREWRERTQENRIRTARDGMRAAFGEMGTTVAIYFTPEEKTAFARFAETKRAGMSFADVEAFALPLAQNAGLAELESRWRYQLMMETGPNSRVLMARMEGLVGLQRRRLKFAELGSQLEQFAPRVEPLQKYSVWVAAAEAYRSANDPENELRVLAQVPPGYLGRDAEQQLFKLLLARRPQELVQRASTWNSWGQDAADFVIASGDAALAHAVVASRGRSRTPVWSNAYNALVGLYFAEPSPEVNGAFLSVLGDRTIGERLPQPVDRAQELAGNIWFYYGSRYGEYAGLTKQNNPEDFLPATLEQSPGTASAYLTLADYYMESGDNVRAVADYEHTLELAPARADVHNRLALVYYEQGARAEALAQWKQVFSLLEQQVDIARVPESLWSDFGRACDHLRAKKAFNDLKPDVDSLLRTYLRRNGNYRSNALLHSAYVAVNAPSAATTWLLDLASVASDPSGVLGDVVETSWIPLTERAPIYQRILQARQESMAKAEGLEKEGAQQILRSWQIRWVKYLASTQQYRPARDAIAALPKDTRDLEAATLVPLELQVAAKVGTLDSKIEGYRADPQTAPGSEVLRAAARQLFEAGDKQSARKVLEFVFAREIEEHKLVAANFLGLAEIRIAAGDTPGAVELLRRLVVAVGNPFENLEPAAALLEKGGHNAEAIEFLEALVKSAPWEADYRLHLAKAQMKVTAAGGQDTAGAQNALVAIASGAETSYSVRARAALALAGLHRQVELGSKELNLLAGSGNEIPAALADQPYFYEARLQAAQGTGDARARIQLLGNALADTPARDDARIPLFKAAAGLHSDELVLAVTDPLRHQQFFSIPALPALDDEEITGYEGEDEAGDQDVPVGAMSALKLPVTQRAQIAWTLGEVMARLNRLNEAMSYLQIARKLEKTPGRRKEISSKIDDVRARHRRQQLNATRQPILHEALEQDRVVRPRLLARASPPAKAAAKGSVKP
jgi:tetratricopeptide (TPR) repeat protein